MASFTQWYRENFDVQLHHETTQMLEDSALLFDTANHFLMLCRANDVEPTAEMADSTGGHETAPAAAAPVLPPDPIVMDPWTDAPP